MINLFHFIDGFSKFQCSNSPNNGDVIMPPSLDDVSKSKPVYDEVAEEKIAED